MVGREEGRKTATGEGLVGWLLVYGVVEWALMGVQVTKKAWLLFVVWRCGMDVEGCTGDQMGLGCLLPSVAGWDGLGWMFLLSSVTEASKARMWLVNS